LFNKFINDQKQRRSLYLQGEPLKMAEQTSLSESQQWVLALGALYPAYNGQWLNTMSTGAPLELTKTSLERWWGLHDRESYFEIEDSLSHLSSQKDYEAVWAEIRRSFEGYTSFNSKIKSAGDTLGYFDAGMHHALTEYWKTRRAIKRLNDNEIEINGSSLKEKFKTSMTWFSALAYADIDARQVNNLSAWDISRFIYISRDACELGWISEVEYFELTAPAAKFAQDSYASWKDFLDAHFVAAMLWNFDVERHKDFKACHARLLSDPISPMLVLPWNLHLQF
jgi:hypothetical protein